MCVKNTQISCAIERERGEVTILQLKIKTRTSFKNVNIFHSDQAVFFYLYHIMDSVASMRPFLSTLKNMCLVGRCSQKLYADGDDHGRRMVPNPV